MPLGSTLVRGLSLRKSNEKVSTPSKTYFPSAPNKNFDIKKTWFASGRQPMGHPVLQPHQISTLTSFLSLPRTTPLLATRIAALGAPLARPSFTNAPKCLYESHTWFEVRWIEEFTDVIGEEIGPRLARLRGCPADLLSSDTKELLMTLEPYLHLFPTSGSEAGTSSHASECHRATCSICSLTSCPACKLSLFLQNPDAVQAVKICAFGRKKRDEPWPEACAWLDPEPGVGWEAKWKHEGGKIQRDRAHVQRYCRNTRHSVSSGASLLSGYSEATTEGEAEALELIQEEDKTSADEQSIKVYMNEEDSHYTTSMQATSALEISSARLEAQSPKGKSQMEPTPLRQTITNSGGEEEMLEENEKDPERKAAAWAQSFEQMTGQRPQPEWYRPCSAGLWDLQDRGENSGLAGVCSSRPIWSRDAELCGRLVG